MIAHKRTKGASVTLHVTIQSSVQTELTLIMGWQADYNSTDTDNSVPSSDKNKNSWRYTATRRSQWPRVLRHGFAAAHLLELRVRIPPGHRCLSLVGVVCCQVEVSASGWSLVQSSAECGVSKWVWSWSFYNEEVLAHKRLLRHGNKEYCHFPIVLHGYLSTGAPILQRQSEIGRWLWTT
jgi:hypothetical protein